MVRRINPLLIGRFFLILFLLFGLSSRNSFAQQAASPITRLASVSVSGSAPKIEAFTYGLMEPFKLEAGRLGHRRRRQNTNVPIQPNLPMANPQYFTPSNAIPNADTRSPLIGRWTGTVTQEVGTPTGTIYSCEMDIEANPQEANSVLGTAWYDDGKNLIHQFNGTLQDNIFHYQDYSVLPEQTSPVIPGSISGYMKQGDFSLASDGAHLAGRWSTPNGLSGTIELERLNSSSNIVNIFIGGFFDETIGILQNGPNSPIKGYYRAFKVKHPNSDSFKSEYHTYDQDDTIISEINSLPEGTIINIIGHSYGGDTAVNVAGKCNKKIELLITIDPVGGQRISAYPRQPGKRFENPEAPILGWQERIVEKCRAARANVKQWIDIDAVPKEKNRSDKIADWGGKWDTLPDQPQKFDDRLISAFNAHHADVDVMMSYLGPYWIVERK